MRTKPEECHKRKARQTPTGAGLWKAARTKLPPPTLEEVETTFRAAENWSFDHRYDDLKNPMR